MRENINKVSERDGKLTDLADQAGTLPLFGDIGELTDRQLSAGFT
jgi:hypothetical protein